MSTTTTGILAYDFAVASAAGRPEPMSYDTRKAIDRNSMLIRHFDI